MPAVVLLGDINIDLLLTVPAYPGEGGEAIASQQLQLMGGSATNTAVSLARLGPEARLIGRVGSDASGDQALADLAAAGIRTDWVGRDPVEPTQLNIVIVGATGERTMFAYRGANARLAPEHIEPASFTGAGLLHLSGYALLQTPQRDAALRALELARAAEIPVTLDIPAGIVGDIAAMLPAWLAQVDTVLLGTDDLVALGLTDPRQLLAWGVRALVLKGGRDGCQYISAAGNIAVPGFAATAVDTTGAGDALAAGFIAGRIAGLSPEASCLLGNLLGALAVGRNGAGLAMPGAAEALHLLDKAQCEGPARDAVHHWLTANATPATP